MSDEPTTSAVEMFFDTKLSNIFCSAEQIQTQSHSDFQNSYNICSGAVFK